MNMSGFAFLVLVLQTSNSFNLNASFNSSSVYFFLVIRSIFNCCCLQGSCVSRRCLFEAGIVFLFRLKSSNCFSEKLMFPKGPSIFVTFVCNDGALILHLRVIALLASLTKSIPVKITKKLNLSRLGNIIL